MFAFRTHPCTGTHIHIMFEGRSVNQYVKGQILHITNRKPIKAIKLYKTYWSIKTIKKEVRNDGFYVHLKITVYHQYTGYRYKPSGRDRF